MLDYVTKPVSRADLRKFANLFRQLFDVKDRESPFPTLDVLERLPDVFGNCSYIVVEDNELPKNHVAECDLQEDGSFLIKIKRFVYDGAAYQNIGAYKGFILHEICHVFMYKLGYVPSFKRSFDKEYPLYMMVEWQVKALTGEIAMPYEETAGMTAAAIIRKYNVSKGFANMRQRY